MSQFMPADILEEIASMRRYARSLTHDDQSADDIVQDAVMKALEKLHLFRPDGSRRGWLLAIVHNIFVSARRRDEVRARHDLHFAALLTDRLEPDQEDGERLRRVALALARLPEQRRAVLQLIAVEERSYQEAAVLLGIPVGTVMSRLSRARRDLRRCQGGGATPGRLPHEGARSRRQGPSVKPRAARAG